MPFPFPVPRSVTPRCCAWMRDFQETPVFHCKSLRLLAVAVFVWGRGGFRMGVKQCFCSSPGIASEATDSLKDKQNWAPLEAWQMLGCLLPTNPPTNSEATDCEQTEEMHAQRKGRKTQTGPLKRNTASLGPIAVISPLGPLFILNVPTVTVILKAPAHGRSPGTTKVSQTCSWASEAPSVQKNQRLLKSTVKVQQPGAGKASSSGAFHD